MSFIGKSFPCLLILIVCLILPSGVAEKAEDTRTYGDFTYRLLEDGTAEITGYKGKADVLTIPSELNGVRVSSIGESAFFWNDTLTEVEIESGILSVCKGAFAGCKELTAITLPETVTFIGSEAFSVNSSSLTINIPDSVSEIEANPFSNYVSNHITMSKDHPFIQYDGLCSYYTKQDMRLVWVVRPPQDYVIPDGIRIIGDSALSHFYFKSLTIPDSVVRIERSAFLSCYGLDSVDIPGSVTEIGDYAFVSCGFLKTITLHEGLVSIGKNAFAGMENLVSINIPESVESIGEDVLSVTVGFDKYASKPGKCTVTVVRGSYGETYCKENYIPCTYR